MNEPKNLNPTSYQVVAYFTWGRKGPLTHLHKIVCGFFYFSTFASFFLCLLYHIAATNIITPTTDAKTRTPTAIGNVSKKHLLRKHKNTEMELSMIKTHLTHTDSIVMRNIRVLCGLLACSWNKVTGLDSDGRPRYLFAFAPVPSLDFFPLDLRPDLEP